MALDSSTAMGIDLRVETESGGILTEVGDPHSCVARFLVMSDLETTTCLRFIDPYGDTVFNGLQMPVVEAEIETALPQLSVELLRAAREERLEGAISAGWQQTVIEQLRSGIGTERSRTVELEEVRQHMNRVLEAVRMATASGPHVYLRFVGD
jgi:hypothetical protein